MTRGRLITDERPWAGRMRGFAICAALGTACAAAPAAEAKPNLRVLDAQRAPSQAAAGTIFHRRDTVANRGSAGAGRSSLAYGLSRDRHRSRGDMRLGGGRRVRALRPGQHSRGRVRLRVPSTAAPGLYRVLVCADGRAEVRERREGDNCAVAPGRVRVLARVFSPPLTHAPAPAPAPAPVPQPAPAPQEDPAPLPPDTTAPVVGLDTPAHGSRTEDTTPPLAGGAGDAAGDSGTIELDMWRGTDTSPPPAREMNVTRSGGSWSVDDWGVVSALTPETWTVRASQRDAAGNVGFSEPHTFEVVRPSATLLAAGDIADCASTGDEATAALLDGRPGTIAALGDTVYETGTAEEYENCYAPTWGRHKDRTRPVPGNHEYESPNASGQVDAAGYFGYFGAAAGEPGKGWYSYDLGTWHVIALNTSDNCVLISCAAGSEQERWLRADLAANPARCTLAYFHHARFASDDRHGGTSSVKPFWDALYEARADVILSSHAHIYERFARQTPTGVADGTRGIRQFVVGTGGRSHHAVEEPRAANSTVANDDAFGILALTLKDGRYDYRFIPEAGKTFTDQGSTTCH